MTQPFRLAVILIAAVGAGCTSGSPSAPASPTAIGANASAGADTARGTEISGTVTRIAGTCPALRFVAAGVTVQTSRATTFAGGTCGSLAAGAGVVVSGSRQSDGVLSAATVTTRGAPTR